MPRAKYLALIAVAACAGLTGALLRVLQVHLDPPLLALVSGGAVMGAAFLLVWACDAAQADISQSLALALVALIAVLPEYAVDMYFTWQAGQFPGGDYAHYAIANMTGANRLLIGVAWAVIAVICWLKTRRPVTLDAERRVELLFLGAATVYALVVTAKGSLTWVDGLVFLALYATYITIASRRPCAETEVKGPASLLTSLPKVKRRIATAAMFAFSAGAILASAEPFCEGLVSTGKAWHINEFLLVQWLAPLASEMPEFVVAIMLAVRGQGALAFASLLSAKVNQWTLLVGMIPGVFALSSRALHPPIPLGTFQMHEVLLTAAQSLLAVIILAGMRFSIAHAALLFGLFAGQLVAPQLVAALPGGELFGVPADHMHQLFSLLYFIAALAIIVERPGGIASLWRRAERSEEPTEGRPAEVTATMGHG